MTHPVYRMGLRSLLEDKATYFFITFVAGVVVLILALNGIEQSQTGSVFADDDKILVVSNAVAPRYPLPVRYVDRIKSEQLGVEGVAAVNFVPATYQGRRQDVPVLAADPEDMLETNSDLVVDEAFAERWPEDPNSVLLGRALAERFDLRVGDSMALTSRMFGMVGQSSELRLRVVGFYDIKDDLHPAYGILIHERLIRPLGQTTTAQGASSILVRLSDRKDAASVSHAIDEIFADRAVPTRTFLREQYVESFRTQGAGIRNLISLYGFVGVGTALVLLIAFIYYNANVTRANSYNLYLIGFSRVDQVLYLALANTIVIGGGVLLGVPLTVVGAYLFQATIERYIPLFGISTSFIIQLVIASIAAIFLVSALTLAFVYRHRPERLNSEEVTA